MSDTIGRGFAFPLGVDPRGHFAMVDGGVDIEQAIGVIMGTAPGERPMRPEFGCAVHDWVFESVDAATISHIEQAIREALDRWEPRIVVEGLEFTDHEPGTLLIDIRYRVRETNDVRNLVYPFYVIPTEVEQ
jgi:Bacteriophage baseplate protein W